MLSRPLARFALLILLAPAAGAFAAPGAEDAPAIASVAEARKNRVLLPNGWRISPFGRMIEANDLTLNILNTPDGRCAVALNCGYNAHAATLFDYESGEAIERVPLKSAWYGMAWSPDGKTLYISGGNDRRGEHAPLHVLSYDADATPHLKPLEAPVFRDVIESGGAGQTGENVFPLPEDSARPVAGKDVFWSGLAHHPEKPWLFAANRTAGHVVVFDSKSGAVLARIETQVNPYDLIFSPDGKTLYVSNWGSGSVSVIDVEKAATRRVIPVGGNPNDMVLAKDGRLFVACSKDNSVYVINTRSEKAVARVVTSLWESDPAGSTPNFLALGEDEEILYVANADNNNLCVIEAEAGDELAVLGFIPTATYPSAIGVSGDGKRIAVGSGKGVGSSSNLRGPMVGAGGGGRVGEKEGASGNTKTLMKGSIHVLGAPESGAELKALTALVYENAPYHEDLLREARPPKTESIIPATVGKGSPIKHAIYILKENRTYDQILGDIGKGNSDPRIAIFGRDITPNHHALAEQYVLFDNFYVDAEASVDGHSWSNAAYATDFNEKNWPADYGGRIARPPYTEAARPPAGYLWDLCGKAGLTYRSYGEMEFIPSLKDHIAPEYKGWKAELDQENAEAYIKEIDQYDAEYDNPDPAKRLPNFSIVCLPHDHTYGGSVGKPTVQACVASNDLALGAIVERITKSRYWKETAIFVTEDDAQDGSDHVDCHRSILLCISPYSRLGSIDSVHYTTSSILRTIELLLGLPPMTQYDAASNPLYAAMGTKADLTPYAQLTPAVNLAARNGKLAYGAERSAEMDLSEFDRAPMVEFNEIIWKLVKGADSEMPLPILRFDRSQALAAAP